MNKEIEDLLRELGLSHMRLRLPRGSAAYGGELESDRLRKIREDAIGHRDKPGIGSNPETEEKS